MDSLRDKTINGMIWSFVERFGFLFLQFITNLILARLLTPEDFGLLGMMMVFVALSLTFIDGGFGSALIQKKEPTKSDYSTVFIINIILSVLLYFLLYIFADSIASFYEQPQLSELFKVLGIILLIDSLGIVQNNILIKEINFKKIARIKITAAFVSCLVAILFAYKGFGVWSLIIQYVLNSTVRSLLLWISTNWRPTIYFSKSSFKELFGFGSKILTARFISELYIHMQALVIGKVFTSADLGFYTQAKQLQQIPVQSLSTIVNNVTFPVYSGLQDDIEKLRKGVRKSLKTVVFINFPLMVLLTVIAKPLFVFLYTEKWLPSVPYFQILCLGFGMLLIVHSVNLSVIKSVGRSDWVLKLEIVKKIIGIILIVLGIKYYGIIGILIALSVNSYLEFFLNGHYTSKAINYSIKMQLKDIMPTFFLSIMVGIITYFISWIIEINVLILDVLFNTFIYIVIYLLVSKIFKFDSLDSIYLILKEKSKSI